MAFRVLRQRKEARRNAKLNEIFEVLKNSCEHILIYFPLKGPRLGRY